jgi:hypothetical protein
MTNKSSISFKNISNRAGMLQLLLVAVLLMASSFASSVQAVMTPVDNTISGRAANKNYETILVNKQIMDRVIERLNELMNVPVQQCLQLSQYRSLHGFAHGMTAQDYQSINKMLYSQASTATISGKPLQIQVGLEDGAYFYASVAESYITYREPGNSGYNVSTAVAEMANDSDKKTFWSDYDAASDNISKNEYSKYFYSCLKNEDGTTQPCLLESTDMYIQCINECELVPCVPTKRTVSKINNATKGADSSVDNEDTEITADVILCKNYEVMEVDDSMTGLLGYIPATDYCINEYAEAEERIGYVLKEFTSQTLGNCYYQDGETLVQRSSSNALNNNYAACQGTSDTHDNKCNIFQGGLWSSNYDPRYRPWYIDAKKTQTEVWTAPYAYADQNAIGITYSIPIYNLKDNYNSIHTNSTSTVRNTTLEKQKIFNGVIAADYYLEGISQYLEEQFADTSMQILIVEQEEPYFLIASSVRDNAVSKLVLVDDNSRHQQPCPADKINDYDLCEPVRLSVEDLGSKEDFDSIVLYRSFQAYRQSALNVSSSSSTSNNNHTEQQQYHHINFKSDDMIGSQAYTARGQTYTLSNLNWIVLVIVPMNRSPTDASLVGTTSFYVVCLLGTVGFVGCLSLLLKFYSKRKERAVIYSDWVFTCAFILGCTTLNLSSLTLVGENSNPLCMLRMWSFNALLVCGTYL